MLSIRAEDLLSLATIYEMVTGQLGEQLVAGDVLIPETAQE